MIIFDLDGTLADCTHREHFVRRPVGQRDWDSFHAAAKDDPPRDGVVSAFQAMMLAGHYVEIWTGRDEKYFSMTIEWLSRYKVMPGQLKMRPTGDRTEDQALKAQWADQHPSDIELVFEDRQRVVDMWRARGVICAQVAPGDF